MRQESQTNHYFGHVRYGHAIIHFLVIVFGMSTWIGVNGIFIELPLLVNIAPEGWNLPAYLVIVTQSANVGPAIYVFLHERKCKINESLSILCLLCLQALAMVVLIFFYDKTSIVGGEKHSLILLVSIFFNALVGCFGSVLFMPYLRDFNDIYIVSYFVGEGLSGVLPSVMALIQGVEEHVQCVTNLNSTIVPVLLDTSIFTFPIQHYFLFLALILILSFIAFTILQYSSFVQSRKNLCKSNFLDQTEVQLVYYKQRKLDATFNVYYIDDAQNVDCTLYKEDSKITDRSRVEKANTLPTFKKIYLYVLIGICCFFSNGFLPSIQSYSCLPYGHLAYQVSITSAQFVNPLACFFMLWVMISNVRIINYLFLICLIVGCYIIWIALSSPTPPLRELKVGLVLIVLSWIILTGVVSYLKLVIVSLLKDTLSSKALFNVGVVMQAGSASGAIISFILINFTDYFNPYNSCSVL